MSWDVFEQDPDDEARQQTGFFTWGIKGTYGCPVLQETVWLPLIATCREHLSTPLLLLLSLLLALGIGLHKIHLTLPGQASDREPRGRGRASRLPSGSWYSVGGETGGRRLECSALRTACPSNHIVPSLITNTY